jgi:hypothetical protein
MRRLAVALVLVALVCPAQASALTPQYTGALPGSNAFVGTAVTGPGLRPNPPCDQLREDHEALRVQQGRLSHQSGVWELRLTRCRGSPAAYRRLTQAIGALDEQIFAVARYAASFCA